MNFTLKIWRQKDAKSKGGFETYKVENISADTSFLEMLDILNNNLIHEGQRARGIRPRLPRGSAACSLHIDGHAHGPSQARHDLPDLHAQVQGRCDHHHRALALGGVPRHQRPRGEPFVVRPDPAGGGFISVRTNSVPDGNAIPIRSPMPTNRWTPQPA